MWPWISDVCSSDLAVLGVWSRLLEADHLGPGFFDLSVQLRQLARGLRRRALIGFKRAGAHECRFPAVDSSCAGSRVRAFGTSGAQTNRNRRSVNGRPTRLASMPWNACSNSYPPAAAVSVLCWANAVLNASGSSVWPLSQMFVSHGRDLAARQMLRWYSSVTACGPSTGDRAASISHQVETIASAICCASAPVSTRRAKAETIRRLCWFSTEVGGG